jgi:hypothetical protein
MSEPSNPNQYNKNATPPKASPQNVKVLLGRIVATPNALEQIPVDEIQRALARHVQGDWGELDKEDQRRNDAALRSGERLLSAYKTLAGAKFWIITEASREATTILLPEDY